MTTIGCRLVCAWVAANKGGHPCFASVHGWINGAAGAARGSGVVPAVLGVLGCEWLVVSGWLQVPIAFGIHVALWVVKKGHRAYRRQMCCLDRPCMKHPSRIG